MFHPISTVVDDNTRTWDRTRPLLEDVFAMRVWELCHPGHVIFWEGDAVSDIFKVGEGVLRLYKILPDGRRAITGFAFAGDVLSLGFHDRCLYTAEAITKVRLRRFPHQRLQTLAAEDPRLHREVIHVVALELEAAHEQLVLLGQKSAEERVASFLLTNGLRVAKERQDRVAYDLPMTRLDMADYLGLTIETVCRAVTKLKNAGLVRFEGRHKIVLQKLWDLACFAGYDNLTRPDMLMACAPTSWPPKLPLAPDNNAPRRANAGPELRH